MDIGLERAGWRTVSFSEIEPYASAVLAERWPDVPNIGDIVQLDSRDQVAGRQPSRLTDLADRVGTGHPHDAGDHHASLNWARATLWSGGFPCQDLSVAGKRSGFGGERSVLAFTFLDLVERHRPPAFIQENVPGLLSSNAGRDFGRLLREVGDLGYWWAYRVLDAQWFGVPQRRRRVFVLAIDSRRYPDPDGPASVLAVGTRCGRDHPAERASRQDPPSGARRCAAGAGWNASAQFGRWVDAHGVTQTLATRDYKSPNTIVRGDPPTDTGRVRAADGMAGRVDDCQRLDAVVAGTLNRGSSGSGCPRIDAEMAADGKLVIGRSGPEEDLLPLGLDSHRYRAIGNGVAAPVAEWIGMRLAQWLK